jgi:hypothetical protein
MLESLLAGVVLFAQPTPAEIPMAHPFVKQVVCDRARGTAFKIGPHRYLSVNHVTIHSGCTINGQSFHVTYADPDGDFSIISIYDPEPGGIEIDCGGFRFGGIYDSIGFARGAPNSVAVPLRYFGLPSVPSTERGWNMFVGVEHVIPGMSGGPLVDRATGKVAGMVNAYNGELGLSWSRALKGTVLCQGQAIAPASADVVFTYL